MNSVLSLISVLIVTILILYLSYVFTKLLGKGMVTRREGSCMKLMGRLPFGQDKAVAVVRTGDHYYLIGITSSQITLLAELQEEDVKAELAKYASEEGMEQQEKNFKDVFKNTLKDMVEEYANRHKKGL